ncbi:hypothetical protein KFE25_011988 [Diacronema lutheri]|uniref:Uncharacterized protein n=1 Tax=Diacronema lutheri TaxID=2081491 RepID=A0A8J5XC11_DIALT|nr:hypothetical protein KFE25_011988 [Diacronema lutheri]
MATIGGRLVLLRPRALSSGAGPAAAPRYGLSRYVRRSRVPRLAAHDATRVLEASGLAPAQAALVQATLHTHVASAAEAEALAARVRTREHAGVLLSRVDADATRSKALVRAEVARLKAELEFLLRRLGYDRERAADATQLELDVEAAEVDDARASQQTRLQEMQDSFNEELATLRTALERSRHDSLTYAVAHLASVVSFGCVVVRFLS